MIYVFLNTLRKNAIELKAILSKSMYIMDSNQYAVKLVTYLLVLVVYFVKLQEPINMFCKTFVKLNMLKSLWN